MPALCLDLRLSCNDSRGQRLPIALRLSARVLGMFSHTTCYPIAFGSWTSQQMPRLRSSLQIRSPFGSLLCLLSIPRKEVIQPHLPIRLPCYDFTPVIAPALDGCLLAVGPPALGVNDFRGVTGGVYKARERIHRSMLTCDY